MSANAAVDHYKVLGVPEHADAQAIEAAYRAGLAKIRASLASDDPLPPTFLDKLREAYQTLKDAGRRQAYDYARNGPRERREPTLEPTSEPEAVAGSAEPLAAAAATASSEPLRFRFAATGSDYFRIWIVNLVLSVLTLGIYSAWAKVRREQFFHRNTLLAGSGFDYHGDPKAILKGRLIAWSLLVLMGASKQFNLTLYGILVLCSIPVLPWMLMRSLRFRAANTSFRGLRFHHRGTYGGAFSAFVLQGLPVLIGGLWLPMWMRAIKRFQLDNLSFGRAKFECAPSVGGFFGAYMRASLLMIAAVAVLVVASIVVLPMLVPGLGLDPGLGAADPRIAAMAAFVPIVVIVLLSVIVRPYVAVQLANLTWNATSVGDRAFVSTQTYRSYLKLVASNFVLVVLTLGLYWPWAKVRETSYRLDHLMLEGSDLDAFAGLPGSDSAAVGEEIADAFDFDLSL